MMLSGIRSLCRNKRLLYQFNHYVKRLSQMTHFYLDELRCRYRSNGESFNPEERIRQTFQKRSVLARPRPKAKLNILYVGFGEKLGLGNMGNTVIDRYAAANILVGLKSFGQISEFLVEYPSDGFSENWRWRRAEVNMSLLRMADKMCPKPDIVMGQMSGWFIESSTVESLKANRSLVVSYSWDDTAGFYGRKIGGVWSGPAALASVVDLNLTSSRQSCYKYQAEGGLALFWPEAANPEIHRPFDVSFEYDVSFVGGRYGYRPLLVEFLRKHGVQVATFGPGWKEGMLSAEEMIKLYSRSRINLGFGGIGHMVKVQHIKGRDFEIPMSGGLYLTSYNPELEECYEIGKEIICYRDKWDCLEKIRYYLDHEEEAVIIRKAGRERALRDHTWEQRLQRLFSLVGLLS